MATLGLIEYADASPEVRAVYDDIMAVRKTDWINNFWKALAHDPATLRRTWESIKQIMAPGALDPLTKEMIYLAVSASNQCPYCIASHTAQRAQGRHERRHVRRTHGGGGDGQRDQPAGERLPGGDRRALQAASTRRRKIAPGVGWSEYGSVRSKPARSYMASAAAIAGMVSHTS